MSAAVATVLSGCSGGGAAAPTGPVDVPVPTSSAQPVVDVCVTLLRDLPETVGDGLARRGVTGDPTRTAAWGDPAVTLACGTEDAGEAGVDGALFQLGATDGRRLSFLQRDDGAANVFTTYGRAVTVEVRVPDDYDAQVVQSMLRPLLDDLPETSPATGG